MSSSCTLEHVDQTKIMVTCTPHTPYSGHAPPPLHRATCAEVSLLWPKLGGRCRTTVSRHHQSAGPGSYHSSDGLNGSNRPRQKDDGCHKFDIYLKQHEHFVRSGEEQTEVVLVERCRSRTSKLSIVSS